MTYRLERRQVVGGSLADVFAFFKAPSNLEVLTPPWLRFRIVLASDPQVRAGTRIRYTLRLHGIPVRWESRITEFVENERFVDEQITGPYRQWRHRHLFQAVPGGVAIEDVVEYRMPFGVLGRLARALIVGRQLEAIFDYRARAMADRFPVRPAARRVEEPA